MREYKEKIRKMAEIWEDKIRCIDCPIKDFCANSTDCPKVCEEVFYDYIMSKPKEETSKNIAINLDFKLPKNMCGGIIMGGSLEELKEAMEIINPPKEENKDDRLYVLEAWDENHLYKNYNKACEAYKKCLEEAKLNDFKIIASHKEETVVDIDICSIVENTITKERYELNLYSVETED